MVFLKSPEPSLEIAISLGKQLKKMWDEVRQIEMDHFAGMTGNEKPSDGIYDLLKEIQSHIGKKSVEA